MGTVNVYDRDTSPAIVAQMWVIGVIIIGVLALYWYAIFRSWNEGLIGKVIATFAAGIAVLLTLIVVVLMLKSITKWVRRYTGSAPMCKVCGAENRYPHIFRHHYDVGETEIYKFCSAECREQWERNNVEYEFSGYYDIQCEDDEDAVKLKNYSSAYEVESA